MVIKKKKNRIKNQHQQDQDKIEISVADKIAIAAVILAEQGAMEAGLGHERLDVYKVSLEFVDDNTGEYVNILGTHPMFRPTIGFNDQNVALTKQRIVDEQNSTELQDIYDMFTNEGAHIIERTADRHDQMMAVIQGLSHLQNLIFTNSIEKSDFDIKELNLISTPVYNMLFDSAARMLAGDPNLPALIQIHNPYCNTDHIANITRHSNLTQEQSSQHRSKDE